LTGIAFDEMFGGPIRVPERELTQQDTSIPEERLDRQV